MAKVAIIIRSYNEAQLIGKCLESVFNQNYDEYEVILVDSESTDTTLEIANRFSPLRVISISQCEFSYGRALNLGIQKVSDGTDILVFLSAHAIPLSSEWLPNLVKPLAENACVGASYGRQLPLPEHLSNRIVRELARCSYPEFYGKEAFVTRNSHFFSNANGAIRHSCWLETPFDEQVDASEDSIWAKQILALNWQIAYTPDACVLHSHPDNMFQFIRRKRREIRVKLALSERQVHPMSLWQCVYNLMRLTKRLFNQVSNHKISAKVALIP